MAVSRGQIRKFRSQHTLRRNDKSARGAQELPARGTPGVQCPHQQPGCHRESGNGAPVSRVRVLGGPVSLPGIGTALPASWIVEVRKSTRIGNQIPPDERRGSRARRLISSSAPGSRAGLRVTTFCTTRSSCRQAAVQPKHLALDRPTMSLCSCLQSVAQPRSGGPPDDEALYPQESKQRAAIGCKELQRVARRAEGPIGFEPTEALRCAPARSSNRRVSPGGFPAPQQPGKLRGGHGSPEVPAGSPISEYRSQRP